MWKFIDHLPKGKNLWVIVQTNKDIYQCRWVDDELNWPGRYEGNQIPIRWTEDPSEEF